MDVQLAQAKIVAIKATERMIAAKKIHDLMKNELDALKKRKEYLEAILQRISAQEEP